MNFSVPGMPVSSKTELDDSSYSTAGNAVTAPTDHIPAVPGRGRGRRMAPKGLIESVNWMQERSGASIAFRLVSLDIPVPVAPRRGFDACSAAGVSGRVF